MKKLYLLFILCLPLVAQAQLRVSAPASIWPELQVSYGVGDEGVLCFRNGYRINTDSDFNDLKETGPLSSFERVELSLGYEHAFTEHWRGGGLFRYAIEDYPSAAFYGLFLRHNGSLKGLYFNKQLLFEYVTQEDQDAIGRYRPMAELGKRFPLGSKFISPSISFEAMLRSEFGREIDGAPAERNIDRTRLRLNLNFELTENLRLNPYFLRQTDYYYVLVPPVYDEQDQLVADGYRTKRNRIMPVFGLELKYSIRHTPNTASISY
ncbi:porin family protein [Pontibacter akesuensis]|uniref:DUF2490 domain-containing protein n=1 Tax=Pontibacter akesuensis TaxID=388950 RepID=A0A1I7JGP9_9BACT|nr:hypothetical protein [Pontibacter akesuensis]GHA70127.1 hypothetical protein GCM10007389_24200 [Pontibacter akesuensis]SFU84300.1 hypothetical protein SAMN04487941_2849 [Pontibacter akesuensis]